MTTARRFAEIADRMQLQSMVAEDVILSAATWADDVEPEMLTETMIIQCVIVEIEDLQSSLDRGLLAMNIMLRERMPASRRSLEQGRADWPTVKE